MHSFSPWALIRAWCHLAPLAMVQAAPSPNLSPAPDPSPDPQPEPAPKIIPAVPAIMGWLGSIGGVLGIISFAESYTTRLIEAMIPPEINKDYAYWKGQEDRWYKDKEKIPIKEEDRDPPWLVGIRVGLDGQALQVRQFPFLIASRSQIQICKQCLKFLSTQNPNMGYCHK